MSQKIDKKALGRLVPALEARKQRDAATLMALTQAVAEIDARIRRMKTEVAASAAGVALGDLAAAAAFDSYRVGTQARIAALEAERAAKAAEERAAREVLARSNGSAEAVAQLLARPEPIPRGR